MSASVEIEVDERGVATVRLARPEKHNAMDAGMISEIDAAFAELGPDDAVRVIVLSGAGRSFCAGADLGWMRDQIAADSSARGKGAMALATMLGRVDACPKPVIGRLHGNAFGGGVGLACVCDTAIGVSGIKLGLTETRLGLIPATIGPYVVARMGAGSARRVFTSGRIFGADEAARLGILSRVVQEDALDDAIEEEVVPYLSCAPGAVAEAKALARALAGAPGTQLDPAGPVQHSIDALVKRWDTEEAEAGVRSFLEKRDPPWKLPE